MSAAREVCRDTGNLREAVHVWYACLHTGNLRMAVQCHLCVKYAYTQGT